MVVCNEADPKRYTVENRDGKRVVLLTGRAMAQAVKDRRKVHPYRVDSRSR